MIALAIDDLQQMSDIDTEGWLVSEPRWLTPETPTRTGDLLLGVEQHTADLINYYLVVHANNDRCVAGHCYLVGMILAGEQEHFAQLLKVDDDGDYVAVKQNLELRPFLFAEITDPGTSMDAVVTRDDRILFYDPPAREDDQ